MRVFTSPLKRWLRPLALVAGLLLGVCVEATADGADQDRERFQQAYAELRTGVGPRYQALRQQLDDYPLAMYLDYEVLKQQLHDLSPDRARSFLAQTEGSPLHNRFLADYLEHKGHDRRWRDFLAVVDSSPRDTRLQCYYYRALRDTGELEQAWAGAERLWNVGSSQDDACDPLFDRWIKRTGGPGDGLVWSRALKAFDQRSPHLIRYVKRFASPTLRPLLDELLSVYRRPDRLVTDAHPGNLYHAQLMTVGIRRLARVNPEKGRQALINASSVQPFTDLEREAMEVMIARHSLFAQSAAPEPWLIETLARLADDELTGIYLRKQIEEGHWQALLEGLDWLSDEERRRDVWRYWNARAHEALGDADTAKASYARLAVERSYHGFLAAEKLNREYALNRVAVESTVTVNDPGFVRVRELMALDRMLEARQEWHAMLRRMDREQQLALAQRAMELNWPFFAIDAANTAKAWDHVDLRFPQAYATVFASAAAEQGVESAELMAIARRESAMYPEAQSRVGARGLMQVMPATARAVARKAGLSWRHSALYDADYNVAIGSRYYRSLLDRFDGHRPKALAGYNAGPNRVERWAQKAIATDQWIDSIPFKETREYVRAVLAYTVIYRHQVGGEGAVLSPGEWTLSHQGKQQ